MICYSTKPAVVDAQDPVRGPARRAEPKAGAKASRGQTVGIRAPANAEGGGLGITASISSLHIEVDQARTLGEEKRRDGRCKRMALRREIQKLPHPIEGGRVSRPGVMDLPIDRLRACGRSVVGSSATVTLSPIGRASISGVVSCGRALVCPECGAKIREERRRHLLKLIEAAQAQGYGVYFVTFTLRHYQGHSLEESLKVIREAWGKGVASGKAWQDRKKKYGLSMVSSIEITYGSKGFHPHAHFVVIQGVPSVARTTDNWVRTFDVPYPRWSAAEEAEFRVWLRDRWLRVIERSGMPPAHEEYAMDWREAYGPSDARILSEYLGKDQGADGAAERLAAARKRAGALSVEALRGDLKTKKRSEHATHPVFELIAEAVVERNANSYYAWWEHEKAVRGLRWWRVSHGLATALGVFDDERTDEEIANGLDVRAVPLLSIAKRDWYKLATRGEIASLLSLVEVSGATAALQWLYSMGVEAERIERPPPDP